MSSFFKRILSALFLCTLMLSCAKESKVADDLYLGVDPPPADIPVVPVGASNEIVDDWKGLNPVDPNQPDRSYKNIWVRMFPVMTAPYRDPYPLTENIYRAELYNSKGIEVRNEQNGNLIASGKKIVFQFDRNNIFVDGRRLDLDVYWFVPKDKDVFTTVRWDRGKTDEMRLELRGEFVNKQTTYSKNIVPKLVRENESQSFVVSKMIEDQARENVWSIINVLPVNDYLLAVVPSEVIHSWHDQALRAQAIAARTYALFEMMESRKIIQRKWDVDPTTWFQSYRGQSFQKGNGSLRVMEVERTSRAVEDTANLALFHDNEILKAYFSSNSGGITCRADECFNADSNPDYLVIKPDVEGIRDETGITGTWGKDARLTRTNLIRKLQEKGIPTSGFKQIESGVKGPSGRTWQIKVVYTDGHETLLSREDSRSFMSLFGGVRSYLYELSPMKNGWQTVVGHGFGHGVGMSQWGAQLFALKGKRAEEIVTYYYEDSELLDMTR